MGQMEQDHIAPTAGSTQPEEEPSSAPTSLRARLRLTLIDPVHPTDQIEQTRTSLPHRRTILWLIQRTTSVGPQVVGVRDQVLGCSRVFIVLHPAPGRAPEDDPPPDPDLPPAGPAQSGARARLATAADEAPDDWPHTRAA
jgi:hypothetical protein